MLNCFILSLMLLCLSDASSVQYEVGTTTSSCTQICSAAGLLCADSMIETMDCAAVAKDYCGSSSIVSNSNIGCTVSGCYVNCNQYYYYSKSSAFSSCNAAGTCLTTTNSLYKHCPCYEEITSELAGWTTVGLYLAAAMAAGGVLFLVATVVKKIRGDPHDHEALNSSAGSYDLEAGNSGSILSSFTGIFGGKKAATTAPKKVKKKVKKTGEKKSKTKMPLEDQIMDETQDMAIK